MDNPLADTQQNTKGAETFGKYEYQYHWALIKLLEEHTCGNEYAIFVEFHEDVILSDSLTKENAKFEFYQVKENSGSSQHTLSSLTKIPSGKNHSILGTLIKSFQGKHFKDRITSSSLVATSGFTPAIVKNNLNLSEINLADLKVTQLAKFKKSILSQLDLNTCPTNIKFIRPSLIPKSERASAIAGIAELIYAQKANSQCDAVSIYRILIDELHRKGQIQIDYSKWDSLIREKSVTSETVTDLLETHSSIKGLEELEDAAKDLISDLNLNYLSRVDLTKKTKNYYLRFLSESSAYNNNLKGNILKIYQQNKHFDTKSLIEIIMEELPKKLSKTFPTPRDLMAAIICIIITGET